MVNLLDLFVLVRRLAFRFSFLCLLCWSWRCCYVLLMVITRNNASLQAWEDSGVKPEKHIKPKSVSDVYPALCCSSVLSRPLHCFCLPVWFVLQAASVPGLAVCLLSPFPARRSSQQTGWWFLWGKTPHVMIDHWTPSTCDTLSCISGNVQRLWPSLMTKPRGSLFPEKAFNYFTQNQQQIRLRYMDSAKLRV